MGFLRECAREGGGRGVCVCVGGGGGRRPAKTPSALITTVTHAVCVHNLFLFCPLNLNAKLTKTRTILFVF